MSPVKMTTFFEKVFKAKKDSSGDLRKNKRKQNRFFIIFLDKILNF